MIYSQDGVVEYQGTMKDVARDITFAVYAFCYKHDFDDDQIDKFLSNIGRLVKKELEVVKDNDGVNMDIVEELDRIIEKLKEDIK